MKRSGASSRVSARSWLCLRWSKLSATAGRGTQASRLIGVVACALLGIARPAAAAIAYVQSAYLAPASGSSVSVKYAAAQTAGDLNVVVVGWNDSTSRGEFDHRQQEQYLSGGRGPTTSSGLARR